MKHLRYGQHLKKPPQPIKIWKIVKGDEVREGGKGKGGAGGGKERKEEEKKGRLGRGGGERLHYQLMKRSRLL
eukprot:414981-Hanusia_phi.AAC.1